MNKQRLLIISFWGGILTLLFIGIALYFGLHKKHALSDTILIRVNESELTAGEFSEELARSLEEFDSLMARDVAMIEFQKNKIIEHFIQRTLIFNWADTHKVEISNEDINKEVAAVRASYPDDISFNEALSQSKQSLSSWKNTLEEKLLQKKLFESILKDAPQPSDEDIKSYYNTNRDQFKGPAQVRLRQIVLPDEDTAQRIYHSITPKSDFADLAKRFSTSPDAKLGGDTGWIEESTMDIFDKAFTMRVGQRSGVVKSPYGYHIFEVIGKKPEGVLPFEDARKKIYRILLANKENALYAAWLEEQIRNTHVFKNTDAIKAIQVLPTGD